MVDQDNLAALIINTSMNILPLTANLVAMHYRPHHQQRQSLPQAVQHTASYLRPIKIGYLNVGIIRYQAI